MIDHYDETRSSLPTSYVAYVETVGGWQGFLAGSDGYIDLWNRGSIQKHYQSYTMDEFLDSRWFPIGSNGGGEMLCFNLDLRNDSIYLLPFIGMADEEPILFHRSFEELAHEIAWAGRKG